MNDFMKEPLAPVLICAIIANLIWIIFWVAMWATGRFKRSVGGGVPILLGVALFNVPFGFLFLIGTVLGTTLLSLFWLCASLTDSFEKERRAISAFLRPKPRSKEGGDSTDENEETKS